MELTVKLQVFEGPLDLLLHLLDKNKVNIYDIPIVEITNQYMEYIREMKRQDLNVMSEFLVMAATLIDIKSKMLLPAKETEEEEAEDPRAELVEQLLEYKMYKCISYELKDRQMDAEQEDKIDPVRSKFGKIEKEEVSLSDKMVYLEQYAMTHPHFSFRSLLEAQCGKMEIIVTFLAVLELMKMGKITIYQDKIFDDIRIESKVAA